MEDVQAPFDMPPWIPPELFVRVVNLGLPDAVTLTPFVEGLASGESMALGGELWDDASTPDCEGCTGTEEMKASLCKDP